MSRTMKCFALTIVVVLCAGSILHASDLSKAEEKEINNYRMTMEKVGEFWQATKNLVSAVQKDPQIFQEYEKREGAGNSLAAIIDATNQIPPAKKAIEDAGMTAKEYWTFQMAMVYAAAGHMAVKAGGTLPPEFSKANVDFYRANEAEWMKMGEDLKKLQEVLKKTSAEEDPEETEEAEEEQTEE